MLEVLRIQNYALIDDVEIEFGDGFNVLTGETGAGKSIIVGALNLVLGGRASAETVRQGAAQAKVDAVFRLAKRSRRLDGLLKQNDIVPEQDELILSRVVTAEGRSRAYACGSLVPVGILAKIGDELVDIHGQHEHQSLLKTDRQLDLLDNYAGTEDIVREVEMQVGRLRELEKSISDLESEDRERARRADFLRFEVREIDAALLKPGEEEELRTRRNLITNAERVFTLASQARTMLYEGEDVSAISALDAAIGDLHSLAEIDESFRAIADRLTEIRLGVEEAAGDLRARAEGLEFDPEELEILNARLSLIGNLKRKFGASVDAVLEYRDQAAAEIDLYESRDQHLARMRSERKEVLGKAEAIAKSLSEKRAKAAQKLNKLVTAALQHLGMKGGSFETLLEPAPLSSSGMDRVEFLLSANPGEKPKPLRNVASGGEISRIMLALKSVFAQADRIPILIFDEIDAGVGGHIARQVAEKIKELAASHQVMCITHIAQIATVAQHHITVAKLTEKGRTTTIVSNVKGKERVAELARLLDGSVSDLSVRHAEALLKEAHG